MVIVALDFKNTEETLVFLSQFNESLYVKVGMELFYGSNIEIIKKIKKLNHKIFLDLKLHDIPNTVKSAMKNIAKLNIDMVNVHASGGVEMMKAAKEGLSTVKNPPLLIAVTQLTSTSKEMMNNELLINGDVEKVCAQYAKLAQEAGLDGVVCSPKEVTLIKEVCGSKFLTVTPGIRVVDTKDDQVRVTTPKLAKQLGSDFIVVGRPITKSEDPVKSYLEIKKDFLGE